MNTRKSSPLPNPHDTIAKYQIAYKIHYQNLHHHLLTKIYIHEAQKNEILKQFTKLTKIYNKFNICHSSDQLKNNSYQLKEEEKKIKHEMSNIYNQVCQKELKINKLYQQSEGILLQLCDMLKSSEQDFKKIRQSNDSHNSQIRFFHHQSLIYNINKVSYSKHYKFNNAQNQSLVDNDQSEEMKSSCSTDKIKVSQKLSNYFGVPSYKYHHDSAQIQKTIELQHVNQTLNRGQIQIIRIINGQSQMNVSKIQVKAQKTDPEKIMEQKDEESEMRFQQNQKEETYTKEEKQTEDSLIRQEHRNHIQSHVFQYSNIQKVLHFYEKPQPQSWSSKRPQNPNRKHIIEISSSLQGSFEKNLIQVKPTIKNSLLSNQMKLENKETKREKKNKNKKKSCITILD